MDLLMQRDSVDSTGCFSTISTTDGIPLFKAGEHAYQQPDGTWQPKIPNGVYQCQLGEHQLEGQDPFQTFEVLGVPGHFGILFHKGNLPEAESAGCILLGTSFGVLLGEPDVAQSKLAFDAFINLQQGVNTFTLTVK